MSHGLPLLVCVGIKEERKARHGYPPGIPAGRAQKESKKLETTVLFPSTCPGPPGSGRLCSSRKGLVGDQRWGRFACTQHHAETMEHLTLGPSLMSYSDCLPHKATVRFLDPSQKVPGMPIYSFFLFLKEISRTLCTVQVVPGSERTVICTTHERPVWGRNKSRDRLCILQAHRVQLPGTPQNLPAAQVQWEDSHLQGGRAPFLLVHGQVSHYGAPPGLPSRHSWLSCFV